MFMPSLRTTGVYRCDRRAEELAKTLGRRRNGQGWMAHCPVHHDHTPSLSVSESATAWFWFMPRRMQPVAGDCCPTRTRPFAPVAGGPARENTSTHVGIGPMITTRRNTPKLPCGSVHLVP